MGSRLCVFSSSLGGEVQPSQHTESDSQHGREALLMLGETGRGMCLHVPLAALMVTQEALEAQGLRSCFFNPSFVSKEQFLQHILKSALDERDQSASALIFAAGGSGEFFLLNSRWLSPRLLGNCPLHMEREALERMTEHDFNSDCPAFFLILTPGKGEDSWTPGPNTVIDCSEQICLDHCGSLFKVNSDNRYHQQREGRVGRVANSLVPHLGDVVEPATNWVMSYEELLRSRWELPDLNVAQQEEMVD